MATYRIRYGRFDSVKYIAHLDMLKLFARASRRCWLPVAYSQGFNPHPLFVFGMPIPVGTTSEDEYVDITLSCEMPPERIIDDMNSVLPESVRLLEAKELPERAPNIMAAVVASRYRVKCDLSDEELDAVTAAAKETGPLIADKRTKSGTKATDIRPMIHSVIRDADSLIVTVDAGNRNNLRPDLAVTALAGRDVHFTSIHRLAMLTEEQLKE